MANSQKNQITYTDWLRVSTLRITRIHFLFILAFIAQIILYDAGKLITPNIVLYRWVDAAFLLIATGAVWTLAHNKDKDANFYKLLISILIGADILFASHNVYLQRGMASRAVFLYVLPIIVSALLLSRAAIFMAAIASATVYMVTAVSYFVFNFNQGYRLELYGEVGFNCIAFLILAALLSVFVKFNDE